MSIFGDRDLIREILNNNQKPMWSWSPTKPTTIFIGTCPRCKSTWVTNVQPNGNPCKCGKQFAWSDAPLATGKSNTPEPLPTDDLLWCAAD